MAQDPFQEPESAGPQAEFVGFWYRLGAHLWDLLVTAAVAAPLIAVLLGQHWIKPWGTSMTLQLFSSVLVAYLAASWILFGRSVGKFLCSQQLVAMASGRRPAWWRCIIRLLAFLIFPPVALVMWVSPRKRGLHDMLAGTAVVADASMRPLSEQEVQDLKPALLPVDWAGADAALRSPSGQ